MEVNRIQIQVLKLPLFEIRPFDPNPESAWIRIESTLLDTDPDPHWDHFLVIFR
jgi:hypothetical protein